MLSRFALALTCVALHSAVTLADDQATLNKIFADWEKRHTAMDRVAYRTQGKKIWFKGGMTEHDPPPAVNPSVPVDDVEFLNNVNLSIDFKQNHFRVEESPNWGWFVGGATFTRGDECRLYDGQNAARFKPNLISRREKLRGQGIYGIEADFDQRPIMDNFFEEEEFAVFPAHGILPFVGRIKPTGLARTISNESLTLQGKSDYKERPVIVLKAVTKSPAGHDTNEDEYCVDPERDSAVVQWTRHFNRELFLKYQIDYEKTAGHWLPSHWTVEKWFDRRHVSLIEHTVKEVKVNPEFEIATFRFELTPGTVYVPADNPHHSFLKGKPGEEDKQLN
jgi:hypothetical protein